MTETDLTRPDPAITLHVVRVVEAPRSQWALCDGHGAYLMISDHGSVAPRKADAVAEARHRMSVDGYRYFDPTNVLTIADVYRRQLRARRKTT